MHPTRKRLTYYLGHYRHRCSPLSRQSFPSDRLASLGKYTQLTRRDKDALPFLESQLLIAILAQRNLNQITTVAAGEFDMHQRTNRMNVTDGSFDCGRAVAGTGDLNIVRTHVAHRRNVAGVGMLRGLKLNLANTSPAFMNPAMKEIDVAQEVIDEGRSRMIVYLCWGADLFNPAFVHDDDTIG